MAAPAAAATGPTAAQLLAAQDDPKLANVLYHDWEASTYDDKWSISYDQRCSDYARGRFDRVAGDAVPPHAHALEIGAGTGFFLLNLLQAGAVGSGTVTDISPGMVDAATRTAARLGHAVDGRVADAEALPFEDDSFDVVLGHAVLHHLPDVPAALREAHRVLRPGGRLVVAGEPTRSGDVVARRLSRATWEVTTRALRLPGLRRFGRSDDELAEQSAAAHLEWKVDLHTFVPSDLERLALRAGFVDVVVPTEELTAAWFGWPARTFECAVDRSHLGVRYATGVYRTWQALAAADLHVWRRVVPRGLFYNALVGGTKPAPPVRLDGA